MLRKLFILLLILLIPPLGQASNLADPASLRDQLPKDTLAYVRIPNLWEMLTTTEALKEAENAEQALALKKALKENVLDKLAALDDSETTTAAMMTLLYHVGAPLEVAFILPENVPISATMVLMATKLNLDSFEQANDLLKQMIADLPDSKVIKELAANQPALLSLDSLPLSLQFDPGTHSFYVLGGMSATPEALQKILEQRKPDDKHPMYALENRIDTSKRGFFQWLDVKKMLSMFQSEIPTEVAEGLKQWGLLDVNAFGWGWGSREGKGRLSFLIDAPKTGYRTLLPEPTNDLTITTAGQPTTAFVVSMPLLEIVTGVEKILEINNKEVFAKYQGFKEKFKQEIGFSLEEVLKIFGGHKLFFSDQAGLFAAVKLADAEQFHKVLGAVVKKYQLAYEEKALDGKTYYHLTIPTLSILALLEETKPTGDKTEAFIKELIERIKAHYYWVEEEGYLILGEVPQSLITRYKTKERVKLQQWLTQQQKQDPRTSLLFLSTNTKGLPRLFYHAYLQCLVLLGDVAQKPIDLFTFPTATDLNLPIDGAYGFQLDMPGDQIGLELTFENNPTEFLAENNGVATVAIVGILAAVAIPAYTDYLKRAKVSEGVQLLGGMKTPAEEFFAAKGRLPTPKEISAKTNGKYAINLHLLDNKKGYGVEFNDPAITGTLKIVFDKKTKQWQCGHEEMNERYLPTTCRQEIK